MFERRRGAQRARLALLPRGVVYPLGAVFPLGALFSLGAAFLAPLLLAPRAHAGPFQDPGHPIETMVAWATALEEVVRGPMDIAHPELGLADFGTGENVLGTATANSQDTLSLGDGGWVTLYLDSGISNGPADDFAVFENGFFILEGLFAELAFVEVSSDGQVFSRFDADALNPDPVPCTSLGCDVLDPSDYHGLAGRHAAGFGTGFDLADLSQDPLVLSGTVDLTDIRYVRLVDVVGDGSTTDGAGNPVFDPYPTAVTSPDGFATGGFDLDAVGVLHVPEPGLLAGLALGLLSLIGRTRFGRPNRARLPRSHPGRATIAAALFATAVFTGPAAALTATFEDLGLGAESVLDPPRAPGGFSSGGIFFANDGSFSGFSASTTTDAATPGYLNQYSNITGAGAGGSAGFGVAYSDARIVLPAATAVRGARFTNTTYAALSMRDGDPFSKKFGGASGSDPDFFRLLVEGFDATGASTGVAELMLADYRFADDSLDFILDEWVYLDLSGLGVVRELRLGWESSDVGGFGINTPAYVAIDDLSTVPEPSAALLLGLGLAGLARPVRCRTETSRSDR